MKLINKFSEGHKNLTKNLTKALTDGIFDDAPSRAERKEMKKRGIKFSDKAAVSAYYAEKAKAAEEAKAAAAEKARLEREANPTTEDLLKEIRDLLKKEN